MNITITMELEILISGLFQQKKIFNKLVREMETFKPSGNINPEFEHISLFQEREQSSFAIITITSASLAEAVINYYIALKLCKMDTDLLADIEKIDLLKKWTLLPKIFNENYKFDKSSELYDQLKNLVKKRNALVHLKPNIFHGSPNDKKVIKGTNSKDLNVSFKNLYQFIELPKKLMQHIENQEKDEGVKSFISILLFSYSKKEEEIRIVEGGE
jgi:hypothetical protein